ncbi:hypothetical protein N7463_009817 [Penicillium fimorum]|uniref:Ankyrin repeat-containing domain n=1 Tax=Penicillium fimorum TaxID=1882269 RepID=A0A9W9XJK3_9EURO|nr:hypothetical protein N7463_009817 [Penicillium fimorum]
MAALLNSIMPEEYDGQHLIVSEKIYSNSELHLEEFMRIALFLLSNNQVFGYDEHDTILEDGVSEQDALLLILFRISGCLNISNIRTLVSLHGATAEAIAEKLFASAIRSCDFQAIGLMLEAGMSPDSPIPIMNVKGESSVPLVYAAGIGDNDLSVKMICLLLLHNVDLNQNQAGQSALERAIYSKNEELVGILISNGVQLPPRALENAFYSQCSMSIFEMLLDAGADMEQRPHRIQASTALGYIVNAGKTELAQLLLSRGANPDSLHPVGIAGSSPYPKTSKSPFLSVLKCSLLELPNKYQTAALGVAACKGDIPMMKILLTAHATINRTDNPNNYLHPLVLAITSKEREATRILLEAGADIQAAEKYKLANGRSLLEQVLQEKDLPLCRILLANGAEAGAQFMQDYYSSQLWEYVKQNDTETVALLLQFGARANDLHGDLPNSVLGLAIINGNWTMISLLQSAGATGVGNAIPFIPSIETARFLEQRNLLPQLLWANGPMILADAIIAENEPLTSLLLRYGADHPGRVFENEPEMPGIRVNTPLEAALGCGDLSLARIIISRGGRVTEAEMNAVMWRAAMSQDHSVLLGFINMFGPFPLSSPTAIAMAVCLNDESAIHHLLEAGVDPRGVPKLYFDQYHPEIFEHKLAIYLYTSEKMGWWNCNKSHLIHSVLELVVLGGNRGIFQTLLGATTWTREEKGRALSISLHFCKRKFVQDLLDIGADIHQDVEFIDSSINPPSNPVKVALSEGDVPLLRNFLTVDRIVDHADSRGYMQYAIKHGNLEQFRILLTANGTVNGLLKDSKEEPLLQTAVRFRKTEIVSLLLETGVDINATYNSPDRHRFGPGGTALYIAGEAENVEVMTILLKAGVMIHDVPTPRYQKTTLWHAVKRGDLEVVKMVLAAGADVNGPLLEDGGVSPLQQAAKQGNMELVDLLLRAGANVNQEPAARGGATALQFAAIQGYIGIVRKLLDAGANAQAPSAGPFGRTALEGAAENGRLDILQLFLNERVVIEDNDRIEYLRAIKLAQQNGHYVVAKFLKSFSGWAEVDAVCYEEELLDWEEERMLNETEEELLSRSGHGG